MPVYIHLAVPGVAYWLTFEHLLDFRKPEREGRHLKSLHKQALDSAL